MYLDLLLKNDHNQSGSAEDRYKPSRFKTSMVRSDLWDYSDAYIVVKGDITVTDPNINGYDEKLAFENNTPFSCCILKINSALIDNVKYLDIVMPMYNLTEYSQNYLKIRGNLWNYYRDEPNSGAEGKTDYSIKDSKSFDYKTKITRRIEGNNTEKEVKVVVSLNKSKQFL